MKRLGSQEPTTNSSEEGNYKKPSKKRKNDEISVGTDSGSQEIVFEKKKFKKNVLEEEKETKEPISKIVYRKNELSSLEKMIQESQELYEKAMKDFDEKEEKQNDLINNLMENLTIQKSENEKLINQLRKLTAVAKGDQKTETLVNDLEQECQDLKEKIKFREQIEKDLTQAQKENDDLKRTLEEVKVKEGLSKKELQEEVDKIEEELDSKEKRVQELQSILEMINVEMSSQEPISQFYCKLKSETGNNELEFKLIDNEANEIEYNPIRCKVKKSAIEKNSFLKEEITFDLPMMKKFFKNVYEVVNNE